MSTAPATAPRTQQAADPTTATTAPPTLASEFDPAPVPAPGLMVGAADDVAEQRADDMADAALRRLSAAQDDAPPAPESHRHDPGCGHLRRASEPAVTAPAASQSIGAAGGSLDAGSADAIHSRRGGGAALPGKVRSTMETAFGRDLGGVRIHDDATSARLSRQMSAHAFTTGNDIFFGAGQFQPESAVGQRVLAHEIAHVVAEGGSSVRRGFFGKLKATITGETYVPSATEQAKDLKKNRAAELKQQRADGIAGRNDLQQRIQEGGAPLTGATPAERFREVSQLLEAAIRAEEQQVGDLKSAHFDATSNEWEPDWSDDRVADEVYQDVYLSAQADPALKFIAPMRATAVERLVRTVREMRTNARVRADMNVKAQGGTTGSKEVEGFYDAFTKEVEAEIAVKVAAAPGPEEKNAARAEVLTRSAVVIDLRLRGGLAPEVAALLPAADSALDRRHKAAATERFVARFGGDRPASRTAMEKAEHKLDHHGDTADSVGEWATTGLEALNFGLNNDDATKSATGTEISDGPSAMKKLIGPLAPIKDLGQSVSQVKDRKAKGIADDDDVQSETPGRNERITSGIGSVLGILNNLKSAVQSAMKFVSAIKDAYKTKDPRKAVAIIKSGSDGTTALLSGAKNSAELAEKISPSITDSVGTVIPGFDIALAASAVCGAAADLAQAALRMSDTNAAMLEARVRGLNDAAGKKADVMVYPLTKVAQSHTVQVEKSSWTTGKSVSDLVTSITSLATAGGFGIPKAVQAGVGLLDMLHDFGHAIAREVLTSLAIKSEAEAKLSLEGSSEKVLERSPAMAVEGIIVRAAIQKDPVAISFLSHYELEGEAVTTLLPKLNPRTITGQAQDTGGDADLLFKIRDVVLEGMGDEADPQHVWDEYKDKAVSVLDKWKTTGDLANQRNTLEGEAPGGKQGSRSFGWRLKMMFKTEKKLARSTFKTSADWDERQGSQPAPAPSGPAVTGPIAMICGNEVLSVGADDQAVEAFTQAVSGMPDDLITQALADPLNDKKARDLLQSLLDDRLQASVLKKSA